MSIPIHVLSDGSGLGETALVARFASAARSRGHQVVAWTRGERNATRLRAESVEVRPLPPSSSALVSLIGVGEASAVVFCSSLLFGSALPALRTLGAPLVSIEFSWIPWASSLRHELSEVDLFLMAMPGDVYTAGVNALGGAPWLDVGLQRSIVPVGWFEGADVRGSANEVFLYFGSDDERIRCIAGVVGPAIEAVAVERPDLHWRFVGPSGLLPSCVEVHDAATPHPLPERWTAGAALFLCHHGMGSIGVAAGAGVPTLAFADGAIFRLRPGRDFADREMHALEMAGVLLALHGTPTTDVVARRMRMLLRRGRRPPQGAGGALRAVQEVERVAGLSPGTS